MPDAANPPQLPEWDLTDLYSGPDAPGLEADLTWAREEADALHKDYVGQLAELSPSQFAALLRRYEKLEEQLGRLGSYAQLLYAGDMSDAKVVGFYQNIQERTTEISAKVLFVTLELNRISDEAMERLYEEAGVAAYRPWLEERRALRPYQLSDAEESLLHEKYVTGRAAWNRLYDETMAGLRFEVDGQALTSAEVLDKMNGGDRALRERATQAFSKGLKAQSALFALITNTLAKDKQIEDSRRGFKAPVSSRNLANAVEDEVVEALVQAVVESLPKLSHRYYALKAKWMGMEKLETWDRNAPLLESDSREISWAEAKDRVLSAYTAFSPDLAEVGQEFFDKPWIDAPVRPGKSPGAFAHPTVPSSHPYLLLNYQGKQRDVMTLAHELGHGVHQVLAAKRGYFLSHTPLTLAETASVFGEMLTFQSFLADTKDPAARKSMLASKVEDMLNTVVRQIAFHRYETMVHAERRKGELSAERLGEIWMETQKESLGPAFNFTEDYKILWSYIPHFIHVPFYVYAYAFGDCLVNSLYAVYQDANEGFADKYLEMLSAGGSKRHRELLAPFGLDASDPAFWHQGLGVVSGMIDELENL